MEFSSKTKNLIDLSIKALKDKKADNIKIINISDISIVSDAIIIASGNNINQLHAMADAVEEELGKGGFQFNSYEGYDKANWILLDYLDVVIHLFDKESRNFYDLERLYGDGIIYSE